MTLLGLNQLLFYFSAVTTPVFTQLVLSGFTIQAKTQRLPNVCLDVDKISTCDSQYVYIYLLSHVEILFTNISKDGSSPAHGGIFHTYLEAVESYNIETSMVKRLSKSCINTVVVTDYKSCNSLRLTSKQNKNRI